MQHLESPLLPPTLHYEGALPVLAPPSLTSRAADVEPHAKPVRWALGILTSSARMHPKSELEKHAQPGSGHRPEGPETRNHVSALPSVKKLTLERERGAWGRGPQGDRKPPVLYTHLWASGHTCAATHQQSCASEACVGWRLRRLPPRGPRGSGIRVASAAGAAVAAPQGTGSWRRWHQAGRRSQAGLLRASGFSLLLVGRAQMPCVAWARSLLAGGTAPAPLQINSPANGL